MTLDILRRTGGWCVELQHPLRDHTREITAIEIRPTTADHLIRWAQGRIPSSLALLSELCDVSEKVLRQLPSSDFDRVIMAFVQIMPTVIKNDWENGARPLATPEEDLPIQEQGIPPPDPIDPRYPAVEGPVRRAPPRPAPAPETTSEGDATMMNMTTPPAVAPVH